MKVSIVGYMEHLEASIPHWVHDAFPPCFRFPPIFDHKFRFSPYFCCFSTFPPCFAKIIISPVLWQIFPPVLHKFTCFYILYGYFVSPPTFTMMHLCITQCTYWTPLRLIISWLIISWGLSLVEVDSYYSYWVVWHFPCLNCGPLVPCCI